MQRVSNALQHPKNDRIVRGGRSLSPTRDHNMKAFRNIAILAALALSGLACGSATVPAGSEYIDVTGTVTMADGKPLKTGTIAFEPTEAGKTGRVMGALLKSAREGKEVSV